MTQKYRWGVPKTGRYVSHLWKDSGYAEIIRSACGMYWFEDRVGSPITDYPRCKSCEKIEQKLINEITGN